jgi:pSer/pThr/pTyr-binding forkhead associated (FHA) protein
MKADPMPASAPPRAGPGALPESGDQTMGTLVYGGQSFDPNDPHQVLALQASLRKARPRLVFANEADRRIVDIDKAPFVIGRSKKTSNCEVTHPGVSSEHARILFDGGRNRFTLEDMGGRNKTFLNNELLSANAARDLAPEAHLRFGPIEALFVVDTDWESLSISPEKYRAAMEVLVRENAVQPSQRAQAEAQAAAQNRHVGEILLQQGVITIRQWQRAFQQGEVLLLTKRPVAAIDDKKKLYVMGGVVALLLIVILVLLLLR